MFVVGIYKGRKTNEKNERGKEHENDECKKSG